MGHLKPLETESHVTIPATPWWGRVLDILLRPVMYWLQADYQSLPQETHVWNNQKYDRDQFTWLLEPWMVHVVGDDQAAARFKWGWLPHFHMPRFGGWKQYAVLEPITVCAVWYVGWIADDVVGISLLPLNAKVRVLHGPKSAHFFALNQQGAQVPLRLVGYGLLGSQQYRDVPLR